MAMLAEPKRRQKLSADPRNKAWSNDTGRVGQQLMEKMGWQQGKGLGMNENGKTSHISVTIKNNSLGLGCSQKHEDNWISHQDDFNDLLSSLNQDHNAHDDKNTPSKPQKLQEKSKKARHRVHYPKFTQGKDLSTYSSSQMKCIMGVRSNCSTPHDQSETTSDDDADVAGRSGLGFTSNSQHQDLSHQDNNFGVQTFTSSNSIKEYFAQKMKELHQKRSEAASNSTAASSSNTEPQELEPNNTADDNATVLHNIKHSDSSACHHTNKKKKKSKRKNKKHRSEGLSEHGNQQVHGENSESYGAANEEQNDIAQAKKNRKRRSHKTIEVVEDNEDDECKAGLRKSKEVNCASGKKKMRQHPGVTSKAEKKKRRSPCKEILEETT